MLNSPAQWNAVYDRRVKRRKMEEAVEGMEAYRLAKLPKLALPAPAPPPPPPSASQEQGYFSSDGDSEGEMDSDE
jgi:hypothetical protein